MPDWNKYARISRLSQIDHIESFTVPDVTQAKQNCNDTNMVNTNRGIVCANEPVNDISYRSNLPCAPQSTIAESMQANYHPSEYNFSTSLQILIPPTQQQMVSPSYVNPEGLKHPEKVSEMLHQINPNSVNTNFPSVGNTNSPDSSMEILITDKSENHKNSPSYIPIINPDVALLCQPDPNSVLCSQAIINTQVNHYSNMPARENVLAPKQNISQAGNSTVHPRAALHQQHHKNSGTKFIDCDETQLKSINTDGMSTSHVNKENKPSKSPKRGRARTSRAVSRSENRSQSAKPYRRHSSSTTRSKNDTVLRAYFTFNLVF
jgi:hypothetical protein